MAEDLKMMLHTLKLAYETFLPVLQVVRRHPDWDKNKAVAERDILEYQKTHPLKVCRGMALINLMIKEQDESKGMVLLACMTESDWSELENLDINVEPNEQYNIYPNQINQSINNN